jgi:hypothetical protein
MRDKRHGPRRANGAHFDGARTTPIPLDAAAEEPVDLVAVQADDELINALSAGWSGPAAGGAGYGTDDRVASILAAWRAEVDSEPIPELVDVDTAVAAVLKARPRPARARHLAPLAAAAAFLVLTLGGVSVGSNSAEPGDVLWPVSKVVFPARAESVEAAVRAEEHIDKAKQALVAGQPAVAAEELAMAKAELPAIRPEEGVVELADVQDFLMAKAKETPEGMPADLDAPLTTQPTRPVPAGAAAPVDPLSPTSPSAPVRQPLPLPNPGSVDPNSPPPPLNPKAPLAPGPEVATQPDAVTTVPAPVTTEAPLPQEPPVTGPVREQPQVTTQSEEPPDPSTTNEGQAPGIVPETPPTTS